jgi:hypothetical protein
MLSWALRVSGLSAFGLSALKVRLIPFGPLFGKSILKQGATILEGEKYKTKGN